MKLKILIIKLGAKGDVVRTLSILPALKEKYDDSEIYWITNENIVDLFYNNPYIKKAFTQDYVPEENYDLLINLDVEKEACDLAKAIKAEKKLGFYLNEGFPAAFNLGAEYYLNTMFDDEFKKSNKKTYQEIIFEASELEWKKQESKIYLSKEEKKYAEEFLLKNDLKDKKLIGIHLGAGKRWPSKAWHKEELLKFIKLVRKKDIEIILFGGLEDSEKHKKIIEELNRENIKIYKNELKNTNREFFSLVNLCDLMICSDSFALHVSLALKKSTIAIFFCTSPNEIEEFGLLTKIVSPILYDFFPEKMNEYSEELTKSIKAEQVFKESEKILNKNK